MSTPKTIISKNIVLAMKPIVTLLFVCSIQSNFVSRMSANILLPRPNPKQYIAETSVYRLMLMNDNFWGKTITLTTENVIVSVIGIISDCLFILIDIVFVF